MIHLRSYQPPIPPACVSKTIQACQRDPPVRMERNLGPGHYVYDHGPAVVKGLRTTIDAFHFEFYYVQKI